MEFEQDFNFTVQPNNGSAYGTLFEMKVTKPADEALKCEFGYKGRLSHVRIDDQSHIAKVFTSHGQDIVSTLPEDANQVYAKCWDWLGRSKTKFIDVTITTGSDLSMAEASKLYIDEIERRIKIGGDVRVSDILSLSETLTLADENDEDAQERMEVYQAISKAVLSKDQMTV